MEISLKLYTITMKNGSILMFAAEDEYEVNPDQTHVYTCYNGCRISVDPMEISHMKIEKISRIEYLSYIRIQTTYGLIHFFGRYRRDLETNNWHYWEKDTGEIIHIRKEHIIYVDGDTVEGVIQNSKNDVNYTHHCLSDHGSRLKMRISEIKKETSTDNARFPNVRFPKGLYEFLFYIEQEFSANNTSIVNIAVSTINHELIEMLQEYGFIITKGIIKDKHTKKSFVEVYHIMW